MHSKMSFQDSSIIILTVRQLSACAFVECRLRDYLPLLTEQQLRLFLTY